MWDKRASKWRSRQRGSRSRDSYKNQVLLSIYVSKMWMEGPDMTEFLRKNFRLMGSSGNKLFQDCFNLVMTEKVNVILL